MTGIQPRYQQLATEMERRILSGVYRPGEKLPSLRQMHHRLNLSISTIYQAYVELESIGLVEARPKSGYIVLPSAFSRIPSPDPLTDAQPPREVPDTASVNAILAAVNHPDIISFASSATSPELLPVRRLRRILREISVERMSELIRYPVSEGRPELRRQISRHMLEMVPDIHPLAPIITAGCAEAVSLSVQVLTRPGDTVAVEAPTHFGFLQLFRELGIRVAEVPVRPESGMDLEQLERLVTAHPVRAVLVQPTWQNPTGARMSRNAKDRLIRMAAKRDFWIVEDDICGEMGHGEGRRPAPLKARDREGRVLYCSSFSKTLTPGNRIGWICPPDKFREPLLRLKAGLSVCCPAIDQYMVEVYLKEGRYARHLRKLRGNLKQQVWKTAALAREVFPPQTRLSVPGGGSLLWLQLPEKVDSMKLYQNSLRRGIAILPGSACTAADAFKNYIRIGCGDPLTEKRVEALKDLGHLVSSGG